jgi:c-di-GMP-related signal transduction protein
MKSPFDFEEILKIDWPYLQKNLVKCFESTKFFVQIYDDRTFTRITVSKIKNLAKCGRPVWEDGITWDDLQEIKNIMGYFDQWCVECYPPTDEVENVANMRHLWVLKEVPEFGWKRK